MPRLHALIGCTYSDVSMSVASFAKTYQLVQVAYISGSPDLSNKDLYPFFLRTRSDSRADGDAYISIVVYYNWKRVGFFYEDDANAVGCYTGAFTAGIRNNILVEGTKLSAYAELKLVDNATWRRELESGLKTGVRVFGMAFSSSKVERFMELGAEKSISLFQHVLCSWEFDRFADRSLRIRNLYNRMLGVNPSQTGDTFISKKMQQQWYQMSFDQLPQLGIPMGYVINLKNKMKDVFSTSVFTKYHAHEFDAIMAVLIAFPKLLDKGDTQRRGQKLLDTLYGLNFTGASGPVAFSPIVSAYGGDRASSGALVFQAQHGKIVQVAVIDASTRKMSIIGNKSIQFPDNSTDGSNYWAKLTCNKDQYLSGTATGRSCKSCLPGSELNKTGNGCSECVRGRSSPNGLECVVCKPGTFAARSGQTGCTDCDIGSFSDSNESATCQMCRAGKYQKMMRQTSCNGCAPGKYVDTKGGTECMFCGANKFQEEFGSSACMQCRGQGYTWD